MLENDIAVLASFFHTAYGLPEERMAFNRIKQYIEESAKQTDNTASMPDCPDCNGTTVPFCCKCGHSVQHT